MSQLDQLQSLKDNYDKKFADCCYKGSGINGKDIILIKPIESNLSRVYVYVDSSSNISLTKDSAAELITQLKRIFNI